MNDDVESGTVAVSATSPDPIGRTSILGQMLTDEEFARVTRDPRDRWRLIRVSTDLLGQFGTRTERGERITAEWGEPDANGIYEPTFRTAPSQVREALVLAVQAMYVDGTLEPAPTTVLSEVVDRIISALSV